MAKIVTDVLRRERAKALQMAVAADGSAAFHEKEAARFREEAATARQLYTQAGASIQVLDGDEAPLDFPEDRAKP